MQIPIGGGYNLQDWESAWRDGDQERMIRLADDYDIWANLGDSFPHPYTRAHAEEWMSLHAGVEPVIDFAVCDDEGPIGGIGLRMQTGEYRHAAALGYWLGQPFWGRGIMSRAVAAITTYAFQTLGLRRIYAHVYKGNEASARVLEKAGYQLEGLLRQASLKAGEPKDLYLYAILRGRLRAAAKPSTWQRLSSLTYLVIRCIIAKL